MLSVYALASVYMSWLPGHVKAVSHNRSAQVQCLLCASVLILSRDTHVYVV
jgi:hypothetical protein